MEIFSAISTSGECLPKAAVRNCAFSISSDEPLDRAYARGGIMTKTQKPTQQQLSYCCTARPPPHARHCGPHIISRPKKPGVEAWLSSVRHNPLRVNTLAWLRAAVATTCMTTRHASSIPAAFCGSAKGKFRGPLASGALLALKYLEVDRACSSSTALPTRWRLLKAHGRGEIRSVQRPVVAALDELPCLSKYWASLTLPFTVTGRAVG